MCVKINKDVCNACKKKRYDGEHVVKCNNCLTWQHSSCTKLTKTQLSLNPKSNKSYFCPVCLIDILPFQQM